MVRVKTTAGVLIDGEHVDPNRIIEVSKGIAIALFSSNKAIPCPAKEPEDTFTREPEPEHDRADGPVYKKRKRV